MRKKGQKKSTTDDGSSVLTNKRTLKSTFNCGTDLELILKVIRGGEPGVTPENSTMGQAVVFNFRMGQTLNQTLMPSGAISSN